MPELHDQDLRKLFRTVGHTPPGADLTARIMARVAVTPIARPLTVEPLIGKRGWAIAMVGVVALLVFAFVTGGNSTAPPPWLVPAAETLRHIRPPQDWPVWTLGTTACALLFTAVDRLLARRTAA